MPTREEMLLKYFSKGTRMSTGSSNRNIYGGSRIGKTKQGIIREGMEAILIRLLENVDYINSPGELEWHKDWAVGEIQKFEHSQGVVIRHGEGEADLWIEPLIEEGK